ncbi:N-acetyl-1-D-myo-inositol-2-amino-2-deoxy-alpha-D-glucopyranoside deacetylase [Corynebacterium epidermidicanis]|uniref:1D-myo-inositol 2-acetamido-2-deoxy-alpha-D-glucopyranoside deacetylase n=1 Tax=Corynebacterium epidermidicanis TaxID=1050174 RepID=A0A0G3GNK0_9CORY|nr:N-acetyl-1-D-myo-inositol-2-amino-2-deoxy-alpha-D-glucopyranoside deacetylase [Corynebacterium epidermidicanis]AKK02806.1 N-acetyl-1-D-myo-inositol-2-amino-2-deoxy-alpha-D-glucopyranoside deacetylase [Corynebacterium epidermidicanis]
MVFQRDLVGLRVVAVHAHPDDEAIWTGGALAELAQRGADVTVITCTLGEQGEIIGQPYQALVADATDQLGGFRLTELRHSLDLLGVHGEYLGGAARWRDSGMIGDPANDHPRAFVHSGSEAEIQLLERFNALRPHLVITYGPDGGYGHPDHIRAHEIAHAAAQASIHPPQRILWAVTARGPLEQGFAEIAGIPVGWQRADDSIAAVETFDAEIRLSDAALATKFAAMKAHPTQLWIADGSVSDVNPRAAVASMSSTEYAIAVFCLSNLVAQPLLRTEHYQLGHGVPLSDPSDITSGLEF